MFGHGITYLGIRTITAQTRILGGVRTLYLGSEEQFVHLFEHHAEEVLNSPRSIRVVHYALYPEKLGLPCRKISGKENQPWEEKGCP